MISMVIAIWSIVFLVTLLGFIPYGILMIYTSVKHQWKLLGLQVAIPFAAFLLLGGVTWIIYTYENWRYMENLYDTKVDIGSPIFEYEHIGGFNGDGYSISVYELPSSVRFRFEAADERLLTDFPRHPSYRDHWSLEPWRRSPFDQKFGEYLDFALSADDEGNASELNNHLNAIRSALKMEGSFYAFFYNRTSGYLGDVDFFIVDLIGGRLYFLNQST